MHWLRRNLGKVFLMGVILCLGYFCLEQREENYQLELMVRASEESLALARVGLDRLLVQSADQVLPLPHSMEAHQENLKVAQQVYENLAALRAHNRSSGLQKAEALYQLGKIYQQLGQPGQAEESLEKAKALLENLNRRTSGEPPYQLLLLEVGHRLALLEYERGAVAEAETMLRRLMTESKPLVKRSQEDSATLKVVANLHHGLGVMLRKRKMLTEAADAHRGALALRQRWGQHRPNDADVREELAHSYYHLGEVLVGRGQLEEAVGHLSAAVNLLGKPAPPERRFFLGQVQAKLAEAVMELGKFPEAEQAHRALLGTLEALVEDYSAVVSYRHALARAHLDLAYFFRSRGRSQDAMKHLQKAQPILTKLVRDIPANISYVADLRSCQQSTFLVEEELREENRRK